MAHKDAYAQRAHPHSTAYAFEHNKQSREPREHSLWRGPLEHSLWRGPAAQEMESFRAELVQLVGVLCPRVLSFVFVLRCFVFSVFLFSLFVFSLLFWFSSLLVSSVSSLFSSALLSLFSFLFPSRPSSLLSLLRS